LPVQTDRIVLLAPYVLVAETTLQGPSRKPSSHRLIDQTTWKSLHGHVPQQRDHVHDQIDQTVRLAQTGHSEKVVYLRAKVQVQNPLCEQCRKLSSLLEIVKAVCLQQHPCHHL
jgi:hypothetical protein